MKNRYLMIGLWILGYLPPLFLFLQRPYAKNPHAKTVMTVTAALLVVFTTVWNLSVWRYNKRRQRIIAETLNRGHIV